MHELAGVWLDHFSNTPGETPLERFDSYCETGAETLSTAESGFRLCPTRSDLPEVAEIIDLSARERSSISFASHAWSAWTCAGGMVQMPLTHFSDDTLRRMLAFRLTYGADDTPEWLPISSKYARHW